MNYLESHAIDPTLAEAVGVQVEERGIKFLYGREFKRFRRPDGKPFQPKGQRLELYWPTGRGRCDATDVLLCEGEGDTLAAASILCRVEADGRVEPAMGVPVPLLGVCPVGVPGTSTPVRRVCGELMAADTAHVYLCFDGDESGRKSMRRLWPALRSVDIAVTPVLLDDGDDLADCLARRGPDERAEYLAHLLADAKAAHG